MRFKDLPKQAQEYIVRYIRGTPKTVESAMEEAIVKEVINQYITKEN